MSPYLDGFPESHGPFRGGGSVTVQKGVGVIACTHGAGRDDQARCLNCGSLSLEPYFAPVPNGADTFDWAKLLGWSCALAIGAGLWAIIATLVYLILLAAGVTS